VPPGNLPIADCSAEIGDTFKKPSWLLSLDYKPNQDVLIYGKVSQSFRGGGTNLRATDSATFQVFRPETAREFEIGLKSDFFDRMLRLNIAGYVTKYKDIQRTTVVPTSAGGVTTSTNNAASATLKGLEIETVLHPVHGLTLSGSANFIDAKYDNFFDLDPVTKLPRDRSGDDFGTFNGVPRTQLNGSIRYELPIGDGQFAMQGNVYYQGRTRSMTVDVDRTFNRDDVDMPAYALLSGRISYRFANDMEISVFGENLANKKYFTGTLDVSSLGYLLGSIGNPRTYGVSLRIPFGAE
jgi:iron complex outermembrane receptor protein